MGTHYQGTPAEVDALNAYIKLMRAADTVTARVHAELPKGLTISQFGALETLLHRGPMCQSELAAKLLKSGGNITLVVDNLEKAGWVIRQRDEHDRRFITVALTPAGRDFIAALFPRVVARITREFASLKAGEQATLAALCKQLGTQAAAITANT